MITRRPSLRAVAALVLCVAAAGCSIPFRQDRADGPFLRNAPLGPTNGGVPRGPGQWAVAASGGPPARARVPAAFTAQQGRGRLPGASLPGTGVYRAVVVPLAIGESMPRLNEKDLGQRYFGAPGAPGTLGDALARESGSAFRLTSEVLPVLVNPDPSFDSRPASRAEIERLAARALTSWVREMDFRAFDNNGPDGVAGSRDDDGVVDAMWVVIESAYPFEPFTLSSGFDLKGRSGRIRTGPVHLFSAPGGVLPDLRIPLDQVLATLGLAPTERFFPAGYPRTVASLGRARLGWLPLTPLPSTAGPTPLGDGQSILIPLSDLTPEAGFWLVERMRENVFTSRVALRPDAHYQVTDSVTWRRGSEQVLPLSYHLGTRGPKALVRWAEGEARPSIYPTGMGRGTSPDPPAADEEEDELDLDFAGSAEYQAASFRSAGVRRASNRPAPAYRWVRLGQDSVPVAVVRAGLPLP